MCVCYEFDDVVALQLCMLRRIERAINGIFHMRLSDGVDAQKANPTCAPDSLYLDTRCSYLDIMMNEPLAVKNNVYLFSFRSILFCSSKAYRYRRYDSFHASPVLFFTGRQGKQTFRFDGYGCLNIELLALI